MTRDEALIALEGLGITATKMHTMNMTRENHRSDMKSFSLASPSGKTLHFTTEENHPIGGSVCQFSPCSILATNAVVHTPGPQPQYGQHTRAVLAELGYGPEEIDA